MDPKMAALQGPALLVYNDAVFTGMTYPRSLFAYCLNHN